MNYLTLGFSIVSFLAAGLIALIAPAHAGLGGQGEPIPSLTLGATISMHGAAGACASTSSQSCEAGPRSGTSDSERAALR